MTEVAKWVAIFFYLLSLVFFITTVVKTPHEDYRNPKRKVFTGLQSHIRYATYTLHTTTILVLAIVGLIILVPLYIGWLVLPCMQLLLVFSMRYWVTGLQSLEGHTTLFVFMVFVLIANGLEVFALLF